MLFNSFQFLLCFLPVTLLGYHILSRFGGRAVVVWLSLASLAFYGYTQPRFLLVLVPSVLINYLFSLLISRKLPNSVDTRVWMWSAVAADLALLSWFKYLFPTLNFLGGYMGHRHWADVVLPLGISFFTFTQIAYIVDLQQGAAEQQDFFGYLLFVTFFPHLIAGPILHHHDIMPQFQRREVRLRAEDLAVGLSWFAMGMFKKVMLADKLSPPVREIFQAQGHVSPAMAWLGGLGYCLQLYFDFSGYCDMACGLARMFSIDFPLNFSSPYKAASVIEFWQRWHITLSQYIGSYLYSPIQFWISRRRQEQGKKVSRKAQATLEGFTQMIAFPTMLTMFLAGIWHGAGVQYLIFGLLHGTYLTVNHGWRGYRHYEGIPPLTGFAGKLTRMGAVLLTFLSVAVSLIFFGAGTLHEAVTLLQRMVLLGPPLDANDVIHRQFRRFAIMVLLGFVVVWLLPNTQQILARYKPALRLAPTDEMSRTVPVYWSTRLGWGMLIGAALFVSMVNMLNPSSFLYFQF